MKTNDVIHNSKVIHHLKSCCNQFKLFNAYT